MKIKILRKGCREYAADFEYRPGYVFVEDPSCDDYDWLVVYDEMDGRESLHCPREHTILATCEPISIKSYSRAYVRQFGHLLTNRPVVADRHAHWHLGRGYYKWFCDRSYKEAVDAVIAPKTRDIVAICSAKQMRHTEHFARYRLVSEAASSIPELDWYGRGVRSFAKKYEVMDPYRYQIVVENHIAPHHWTEKLSDAFLSECLPFYAGAPDLAEDFPQESFIPIPIDDPVRAISIIRTAIANGEYERRRTFILEAKRLILERYNFWAQVIAVIESEESHSSNIVDESGIREILSRRALRKRYPMVAFNDAWTKLRDVLWYNKGKRKGGC